MSNYYVQCACCGRYSNISPCYDCLQKQVERLEKENAELKKMVEAKKPIPKEALKLLIDELAEPQIEALWVILGSMLFAKNERCENHEKNS